MEDADGDLDRRTMYDGEIKLVPCPLTLPYRRDLAAGRVCCNSNPAVGQANRGGDKIDLIVLSSYLI